MFCRAAGGAIFHTYSCYASGLDMLMSAYHYLDLVPKGRDEAELPCSNGVGSPSRQVREHLTGPFGLLGSALPGTAGYARTSGRTIPVIALIREA